MTMEALPAETLYAHLQQLRIDQSAVTSGSSLGLQTCNLPAENSSKTARSTSESPIYVEEPTSSSAGDISSCENNSMLDNIALQHSMSLSSSQLHSIPSVDFQGRASMDGAGMHQQPKSQICFDYTKGLCTRGDKCKYSHDLATIVQFNSKEKGICFDYLRNQCHRGLLCRFSHDLSNIAQQCQASEMFNNTQAGVKGRTNAICYDFVKGVCQRGSECRYSHDLSLIARTARGGQQSQKSGEICYDYLRGRCNRGTSCKYSHNISFLATPSFLSNPLGSSGGASSVSGGGAPLGGPMSSLQLPPLPSCNSGNLATSFSMGGFPGPGGGLAPSISADPLLLGNATAPANMQAALSAAGASDMDGNPLATALSSELSEPMGSVQEPFMNAAAHHALAAAQRRQALAAQLTAFNPMAGMPGGMPDLKNMSAAAGLGAVNGIAAAQQQLASTLAAQQAARALLQHHSVQPQQQQQSQSSDGQPLQRTNSAPLNPAASAPLVSDSISALLANLQDNPMLAETLSNLAAAAQAQAQAVRMSAPGGGIPSGNLMPKQSAPLPARFDIAGNANNGQQPSSRVSSPSMGSYAPDSYPGGVSPPSMQQPCEQGQMVSRASAGGAPANVLPETLSPEMLPLLREIWNK